ncbi:gastrin/cholecystokinin-like peptide [Myxocyprinus asiaticus]|uniref:gastrin/cholecystokinin-like peptide n=1 Tax=Myxocyprinus asiaticus TaxID=70543 RepID=UPI00222370A1|nr:gastrin/cholecystokinin-like peptide [Myxocyprinus asiaticus]
MDKCIAFTVITMLAVACVASPLSEETPGRTDATEREERGIPETRESATGTERLQSRAARLRRFASLPEDQREFMSRQILQALSEIIHRDDCVTDYQGWVDFGRRSTD